MNLISLGLADEKDLSLKALEAGKKEIIDDVTRPSLNNNGIQRVPDLIKQKEQDIQDAENSAKQFNPLLR